MKGRRLSRSAALVILAASSFDATAQTQTDVGVPGRGQGSVDVTVQYITITERELMIVREKFGEITLRAAYFELDYGLTDRLALDVTLPFKSNRYVGDHPHDPSLLYNDHGEVLLDDGKYHSNWGDSGVNLRWLWRSTERLAITPFVGYYWPSNDYPLYTETQAGMQQWRLDLGLNAGGPLGHVRNVFWQAGYAYSYMQETRPTDAPARRVNHSRISFEIGWLATPRLAPYLILTYLKPHNALTIPEFTDIERSDQGYYHDQLLPWEYSTLALGVRYRASDYIGLYASYGRTMGVSFGHIFDPALTFGFSRRFSTADTRLD